MKTCLIQCASGPFTDTQRRVWGWHASYCDRHGIDYLCHLGRVPSQVDRNPMWDRVPLLQSMLGVGYDLVVWLDTDALVVDATVSLAEAAAEFEHVGAVRHPLPFGSQPYHHNCGVMFFKNTGQARELLERTDALGPVAGAIWQVQSTLLTVNDRMGGVITRIDVRWNSTEGANESDRPVVRAWHGQGTVGREKLLERLQWL